MNDPVTEAVIQHAHSLIFTELRDYFTADLDALLLYKILEAVFRDREGLVSLINSQNSKPCPETNGYSGTSAIVETGNVS
jgi:hypothetical protein